MSLSDLLTVPENVTQTAEVLADLDRCFLVGFGRLGDEQYQALEAVARICSGTPLQEPVSQAVEALSRSEFLDRHFVGLAVARAALQGAQYDALRQQAASALGRTVPDSPAPPSANGQAPGPIATWQESTRNWLMELALAGFGQLEYQSLAPFSATLEHLQGEPKVTRLACVLTGFLEELLRSVPTSGLAEIPVFRWADLWTRAMLGSLRVPTAANGTRVSGNLAILGADIRHHGFFVSFDAYGLLEAEGSEQIVRVTRSSYKVDVVVDGEMWQCCPLRDPVLDALSKRIGLAVQDMTLLPSGDLLWDGTARNAKIVNMQELGAAKLAPGRAGPTFVSVAPEDRHPIQLAEPVFLPVCQVKKGKPPTVEADGASLPLAVERISRASELASADLTEATSLLGLLRFDGGRWAIQPLALSLGGKKAGEVFTGQGMADHLTVKKKGGTLGILRERASRLLRQKA